MMSESEIIQGIIDGHNRQVEELEGKIAELSGEIQQYRNRQLPAALITRELAAQYDGVQQVTLTRGEQIAAGSESGSDIIVAIIQCTKPLKAAEQLRIRNWLQVRLDTDNIEVIVNTKK